MSRPPVVRALLGAALALPALVLAPAAAHAASPTVWLCKPGLDDNPCLKSLTAMVQLPNGRTSTERTPATRGGRIDCFYVYPTVSDQPTVNATLRRDPEIKSTARFQASRFAQHCRVYAPVYRQLTIGSVGRSAEITDEQRALAYGDVRDAWREYLRRYNGGRGVVLIGHSQGTRWLRQLIAEEIDPSARERRRIVSALLLGGNVTVRPGSDVGGDFEQVRACRSIRQTGCVVGYSIFDEAPPANSRFGRAEDGLEVLCTDPGELLGRRGGLRTYVRTEPFGGVVIAALLRNLEGELPRVRTPWLEPAGAYSARCVNAGGANVLRVSRTGGARDLTPQPDPTWGLHLADVNLALGDLVEIIGRQSARWLDRNDQGRPARSRSRRP